MLSFKDILSSSTFTFIVGRDETPLTVHVHPVSTHSKVLKALMTGGMLESVNLSAKLPDIDPEAFISFLQFCYTGDYPEPPPEIGPESPQMEQLQIKDTEFEAEHSIWGPITPHVSATDSGTLTFPKRKKTASKPRTLKTDPFLINFSESKYNPTLLSTNFSEACDFIYNHSKAATYTSALIHHATVYIVADQYDVEILRELALYKIHRIFKAFAGTKTHADDVFRLVRFVYTPNLLPDDRNQMDKLRSEVIHYVLSEFPYLMKRKAFLELVDEGGKFAGDLFAVMKDSF